jgi:hypothetical protein
MDLQDFAQMHLPALESDEVRFNVQIAVLTAAVTNTPAGFAFVLFARQGALSCSANSTRPSATSSRNTRSSTITQGSSALMKLLTGSLNKPSQLE